jgi:hypothetical protein
VPESSIGLFQTMRASFIRPRSLLRLRSQPWFGVPVRRGGLSLKLKGQMAANGKLLTLGVSKSTFTILSRRPNETDKPASVA